MDLGTGVLIIISWRPFNLEINYWLFELNIKLKQFMTVIVNFVEKVESNNVRNK